MAGKKGGFITGANAKITLGGRTLAYCTDVGYNVTIQTIPVEAMGRYEVYSNEPVSYTVDGTLSVIRYTKRAKENKIDNAKDGGNSSTQLAAVATAAGEDISETLQAHSTPGLMLESATFDVEIHEKIEEGGIGAPTSSVKVVSITDCRLTRRGMTLNKRGLYVDQYAFVGLLVADALADGSDYAHVGSGVGEDLATS